MSKRHVIYSLPMILLLTVAVAGWFATDYLGKNAQQEIIRESRTSALTLSIYLSSTFTHIEGAVKSLAGSPWIAPALMYKRDQDIGHANSVLDRYNSAMKVSISYLMDVDGTAVASSNRNDPDSFVGKSYRFRPYLQEAAKGQPGRYFALGITSGKRGFYASYPVQNRLGKVLGVVTMKKDLDEIETFFSKYLFCFLVSPDGIIFLSSQPAMVLKSLWPLDKTAQEKLIASQQFGNKLSETVLLKKEIADGTELTLEGNDYLVSRTVLDSDGWSIVLLTPLYHVKIYKLIGILSTISVCFLIMVFSGIVYVTDRSKKAVRESEESKRLLLHAAGEGIFGVDTTGQVNFINPSALRMLGFAEEDVLGQGAHALVHHSHEDGSNYPVEACPMYASYTMATESSAIEEVLWRKDGSNFSVEYSSMPIIRDGKVMGAVVTFRDITERKQMVEALRDRQKELQTIMDAAPMAITWSDMEGNIQYLNRAFHKLLGYTLEDIPTIVDFRRLAYPSLKADLEAYNAHVLEQKERLEQGEEVIAIEVALTCKDGSMRHVEVLGTVASDKRMVIYTDITERKRAEEEIQQMAYYDSLTGLPNRKLFSDRLHVALAQRNQEMVGVAMLDLDKFKDVNDTLGHDVGDFLLKAASKQLSAALRKGDTVARFGGDEFVLILPGLKVIEDAVRVVQKIVDSFCKPFLIDTHELLVTTSIGIAIYPDNGTDEVMLLKNADIAMYQAKQAGRARYQIYKET